MGTEGFDGGWIGGFCKLLGGPSGIGAHSGNLGFETWHFLSIVSKTLQLVFEVGVLLVQRLDGCFETIDLAQGVFVGDKDVIEGIDILFDSRGKSVG